MNQTWLAEVNVSSSLSWSAIQRAVSRFVWSVHSFGECRAVQCEDEFTRRWVKASSCIGLFSQTGDSTCNCDSHNMFWCRMYAISHLMIVRRGVVLVMVKSNAHAVFCPTVLKSSVDVDAAFHMSGAA